LSRRDDHRAGERPPRVARGGLRRRRTLLAFSWTEPSSGLDNRTALVSRALASDIGAAAGGTVLVRIERPTDIPLNRCTVARTTAAHSTPHDRGIAGSAELGEFSLRPQQGEVRAVFVALKRLEDDLDLKGRVKPLLVSDRTDFTGGSKGPAVRTVDVPRAVLWTHRGSSKC